MSATIRDRRWYSGIFVALLIVLVVAAFVIRWRMDTIKPDAVGDKPSGAFIYERATDVLADLLGNEAPHPVDSAANDEVRRKILARLNSQGYDPDVQDVTSCVSAEQTCARVRNIVALREGAAGGKLILVTAHYDSVPAGPGASDDGAGVAILLETARLIGQKPPGKNSVAFLFTEGEEAGLLGAEAFASRHPLAGRVAAVVNMEARGTSGQSMMFETGSHSGWLVNAFASTSRQPSANSLISAVYTLLPNDTDLSVFKERGIQGLNFAYGENFPLYHTPLDNLKAVDPGSLQQQGDNVYDLVDKLMDADLPDGDAMGSVVYTDILGTGMLHWSTLYGQIAAIALVLLFAFASWRLRRFDPYGGRSVLFGVLGFLVSLVVGVAVAYVLNYAQSAVHGTTNAWHTSSLFNRLFLWSSVLLVVVSLQRLLARKSSPVGLWIGMGWAWLMLSVATCFALPGISYLFLLPSVLFVVCALICSRPLTDDGRYMLQVPPALAVFVVVIPAIFLVEIMLGFNGGLGILVMGGFIGVTASVILPFAQSGNATRVYAYVTYVGLAVVVVSGALSFRAPAYTAQRPQPLNVMYVQDDHGKALVAAGTAFNHPPESVLAALGPDAALNNVFPWTDSRFYTVAVPTAALPPARLTILNTTNVGGSWQVTARIDADEHASMVELLIPRAAGLQAIEVDGNHLDYSTSTRDHNPFICRGASCNGRQITMTLKETGHEAIIAVEYRQLPEKAAAVARARGNLATARSDGNQSLVLGTVQL